MTASYVHGSTDDAEIRRLERQADWTSAFTFPRFDAAPGHLVLDLACGVGAIGSRLATSFPGAHVIGLDLSATQLAASRRNHPGLPVIRGDGRALPLAGGVFDRVHCSWMLEYVREPLAVLREVRRVLRPGGWCQFVEVDNESFSSRPTLEAVGTLMRRLDAAQRAAGGDPCIGPSLDATFLAAGFGHVTLEPVVLVGDARRPAFLADFVDEFVGIFRSLDESLGPGAVELIERAVAELERLPHRADAELRYTAWIARGQR